MTERLLARRRTFAEMIDASTKHVDRLVRRGLPSIGRGRARRIDVQRAIEWLRANAEALAEVASDDPMTEAEQLAHRAAARDSKRDGRKGVK